MSGNSAKRPLLLRFFAGIKRQLEAGLSTDDFADGVKRLTHRYLGGSVASVVYCVFAHFFFHFLLLWSLVYPITTLLPSQTHGVYKIKDVLGNWRRQITLFFFALSAGMYMAAIPAAINPFNWSLALRPQINIKPEVVMQNARSSKSLDTVSHKQVPTAQRSKSCMSLMPNTTADLGMVVKVQDGILDKFWNATERIGDALDIFSRDPSDSRRDKTQTTSLTHNSVEGGCESDGYSTAPEDLELDLDVGDSDV